MIWNDGLTSDSCFVRNSRRPKGLPEAFMVVPAYPISRNNSADQHPELALDTESTETSRNRASSTDSCLPHSILDAVFAAGSPIWGSFASFQEWYSRPRLGRAGAMDRMERARDSERAQLEGKSLPRTAEGERFDAYAAVTSRIVAKIESGVVPWQSPSIARVGFPRNFSTGKRYSGINVFLLGSQEFQSPHFLTFIQARELGGHVRKGEQGFPSSRWGAGPKM